MAKEILIYRVAYSENGEGKSREYLSLDEAMIFAKSLFSKCDVVIIKIIR